MDAAAEDLQQVAADALDSSYRSTHDTVQQLIDSALQSAGSSLRLERKARSSATSRAKAYIYTAQPRHASNPRTVSRTAPEVRRTVLRSRHQRRLPPSPNRH